MWRCGPAERARLVKSGGADEPPAAPTLIVYMALVVQKFGGTSLADADRIRNVARRVVATHEAGNSVVVVVTNDVPLDPNSVKVGVAT